ncbi:MAG: hypothetical protein ABSE05_03695 [Syntrophales bacterium]
MLFANQKGNVIAYVVIAMTTIAALAVGALYMTSSSALGELAANNLNRAYSLAMAGKDYALIINLGDTSGRIFTLQNQSGQILPSNDKFQLDIIGNIITSTGIVNAGTPFETRRQISIKKVGFSSQADISSASGTTSFVNIGSQQGFIDTSPPGGATVIIGKSDMTSPSAFGAVWYNGGGAIQQSICTGGPTSNQCSFGSGFRAFFVFEIPAGYSGDGFTFTIFNADPNTNDIYSVGGGNGWGELMGYAGDSRSASAMTGFVDLDMRTNKGCCSTQPPLSCSLGCQGGRGIQPPKVAIEFDTLANSGFGDICTGGTLDTDQRGDGSTNHMAYVFWGTNDQNSNCGSSVGANTFDDNRHGAGTGGQEDPQNGRSELDPSGIDTTSYFRGIEYGWPANWLLSNSPTNTYAVRVEVTRNTLPDPVTGNYSYTVNTWIKPCQYNDYACLAYLDGSNYANTKIGYTADSPTLSRTFTLSPTYHQKFSQFYFGWTAATSQVTAGIGIYRFAMYFLK